MTLIAPITEMRDTSKMFQLSGNQQVFITKNGGDIGSLKRLVSMKGQRSGSRRPFFFTLFLTRRLSR